MRVGYNIVTDIQLVFCIWINVFVNTYKKLTFLLTYLTPTVYILCHSERGKAHWIKTCLDLAAIYLDTGQQVLFEYSACLKKNVGHSKKAYSNLSPCAALTIRCWKLNVREKTNRTLTNLNTHANNWRLLSQPPRKLALPATRTLCKCLISKSTFILWDGESISFNPHVSLFF
jgi:hypothetical protein